MLKISALLAILSVFNSTYANQLTEIDDRLFDVEEKMGGKYPITPIDAKKARFGGALRYEYNIVKSNKVYSLNSGVATTEKLQVPDTINTSNARMDLYFAGDVNDDIEYLLVPSLWHNTAGDDFDSAARTFDGDRWTEMIVYRLWGMYKTSFGNFKFGRMLTPFGTYMNTYSPVAEIIPIWPQSLLLGAGNGRFVDINIDGIQYQKMFRFGQHKLNVQIYTGVNSVLSSEAYSEVDLTGNPEDINVGARIRFTTLADKVDVGVSAYHGRRRSSFTNYALDTTLRFGRFSMKGEYVFSKENTFSGQGCNAKQVADAVYRVAVYDSISSALGKHSSIAMNYVGGDETLNCRDDMVKGYNLAYAATGNKSLALLAYLQAGAKSVLVDDIVSDKTQWYIEPSFQITDKILLATRFDYIDLNSEAFHMGEAKKVMSATLNYKPYNLINFQFSAIYHDYKAPNGKNEIFRALDGLASGDLTTDASAALNLAAVSALGNPAAGAASYAAMKAALLSTEDVNAVYSKISTNPDFMEYRFNVVFSF